MLKLDYFRTPNKYRTVSCVLQYATLSPNNFNLETSEVDVLSHVMLDLFSIKRPPKFVEDVRMLICWCIDSLHVFLCSYMFCRRECVALVYVIFRQNEVFNIFNYFAFCDYFV